MRLGGIKVPKGNSRDSISKALFQRDGTRFPGKEMLLGRIPLPTSGAGEGYFL